MTPDGRLHTLAVFAPSAMSRAPSLLAGMGSAARIPTFFVDGGISFDPYCVSAWARLAGLGEAEVLKGIMIARAFTCHQIANLLAVKTAAALRRAGRGRALVVVSRPVSCFGDEDVGEATARPLFSRTMKSVREMSETLGARFAFFQDTASVNPRRAFFLDGLAAAAQLVLTAEADGGPCGPMLEGVKVEKPPGRTCGGIEAMVGRLLSEEAVPSPALSMP